MRKDVFKKILAASLAVVLAFGGMQFSRLDVKAASSGLTVENLTDQNGWSCSFIAQANNTIESGTTVIRTENVAADVLFDGLKNSYFALGCDNSGTATNIIVKDDYVGVLYTEDREVLGVGFTFDSSSTTDRYYKAKLQVTTDATNWSDVEGATYSKDTDGYEFFVDFGEKKSIRGFRMVCTDEESHAAWFRLMEIQAYPANSIAVNAEVLSSSQGMGTVSGSGLGVSGSAITLTATPNGQFRFEHWQDSEGNIISRSQEVTVTVGDSEQTYYAKFRDMGINLKNVALNKDVSMMPGVTLTNESSGGNIKVLADGAYNQFVVLNTSAQLITENDITTTTGSWVQIDLGEVYSNIDSVKMVRYHNDGRTYGPTVIALSDTGVFDGEQCVIFNSYHPNEGASTQKLIWTGMTEGTEQLYRETSGGREFPVPAGVSARYVRIYWAGGNSYDLNNNSAHIIEVEVLVSEEQFVSKDEVKAITAGTEYKGNSSTDKDAQAVFDGDKNTVWHSNYDQQVDNSLKEKFWIDFEFESEILIDGIYAMPRETNENGIIASYQIWVSNKDELTALPSISSSSSLDDKAAYTKTWQDEFTKVCEGTWQDVTTLGTWKSAKFVPVKAKHVRLVATSTRNNGGVSDRFVTLREMRVSKVNAEKSFLKGGSLRMDYADTYDKACLRFQYEIPAELNGLSIKEGAWGWKYATNSSNVNGATMKIVTPGKYMHDEETNKYSSNMVFTNISSQYYTRDIYTQLVVAYGSEDAEELTVYCPIENRSVQYVAQMVSQYGSTQEQKDYANGILSKIPST